MNDKERQDYNEGCDLGMEDKKNNLDIRFALVLEEDGKISKFRVGYNNGYLLTGIFDKFQYWYNEKMEEKDRDKWGKDWEPGDNKGDS